MTVGDVMTSLSAIALSAKNRCINVFPLFSARKRHKKNVNIRNEHNFLTFKKKKKKKPKSKLCKIFLTYHHDLTSSRHVSVDNGG